MHTAQTMSKNFKQIKFKFVMHLRVLDVKQVRSTKSFKSVQKWFLNTVKSFSSS